MLYEKTVTGGGMWSNVISRGKTLRITDIEGGANVGMLLYNEAQPTERYNMPDTLKGQYTFYLTKNHCLHSDMGRLFCSITEDTAGWHDTVCGCLDAKRTQDKYGNKPYQTARNDFHRNAKDNFLTELNKWGLGKRDLVPNLNLFSKVTSDDNGALTYIPNSSPKNAHIDLRFEMDTLVVLNTCQHPLDPNPNYAPKPVTLQVTKNQIPQSDDPCFTSRPENTRAIENTNDYYALRS